MKALAVALLLTGCIATSGAGAAPRSSVALGRKLFFDRRLSVDATVSCASCHNPRHGFSDPRKMSTGAYGRQTSVHTPGLWNVAHSPTLFWDGRADSLEHQVEGPLLGSAEMGMGTWGQVMNRLATLPDYRGRLQPVSPATVARALASFERSLVSQDAPFDQAQAGQAESMTSSQKRGQDLFFGAAECGLCHACNRTSPWFTDGLFHNTGLVRDWGLAFLPDPLPHDSNATLGRFAVTGQVQDLAAFKTPSLRNVALRGPYMHDGSLRTLRDVLRYYNRGGSPTSLGSNELDPLGLSDRQLDDLEAFLRALSGRHAAAVAGP